MGNVVLHLQIVEWKFNVVLDLTPHSVNELEAFQLKYQDLGQALKLELFVVLCKRLAPLDILNNILITSHNVLPPSPIAPRARRIF